jgi:fibronectin-binding autotransporter adhesin
MSPYSPASLCGVTRPTIDHGSYRSQSCKPASIPGLIFSRFIASLFLALALLSLSPRAYSATDTWVGGTSALWADPNWTGGAGSVPATGDSLVFAFSGTTGAVLTDNLMTTATYTIAGITFNSGAPSYLINSGTAGVNGFTLAGAITNNSSNLETIDDAMFLSGVQTIGMLGGGNITLGGPISGTGGITVSGTGTLTLSGNDTYTGASTYAIATTVVTGTIGALGAPSGAITVGQAADAGVNDVLTVGTGGAYYATSMTLINGSGKGNSGGPGIYFNLTGGILNLTGGMTVNTDEDDIGLATFTSGTATIGGSVVIGRSNAKLTSLVITPQAGSTGIYVNGATMLVSGSMTVGGSSSSNDASTSLFRIDSGLVNVVGAVTVTDDASMRYNILNVNGGTFIAQSGMVLGSTVDANPLYAEILISGGTTSTPSVTFGGASQGSGNLALVVNGGTLLIGPGGFGNGGGSGTEILDFGSAVATAPIIQGTASWSSAVGITLATSTAGVNPTIETSDLNGNPLSITGSAGWGGSGGYNLVGSGTLTLVNAASNYSGTTNIGTNSTLNITSGATLTGGGAIVDAGVLNYTSAANDTFAGPVTVTGTLIDAAGANTLTLAGADTITGTVSINSGTLKISGLVNSGTYAGNLSDAGTFAYAGSANQTFSGIISGTGGVTQAGLGRLFLTGPNTYTGPTAITSGTMVVAGSGSLGDTAITVGQGAGFAVQPGSGNINIGNTAASLTLSGSSVFSMADGAIGTVTLNGTSASALNLLGTASAPSSLVFDVGHTGADELLVPVGGIAFATSAQDNIVLSALSNGAPSTLTSIPLLYVPNGVLTLADFSLPSVSVAFGSSVYNASLSLNGSDNELLVSFTLAGSANYYFTGKQGASWGSSGNFSIDQTGVTAQTVAPIYTSNIFLAADGATNYQTETIDGNLTVNSLSFTGTNSLVNKTPAAVNGITLNGGSATAPLLIEAANSFSDANNNTYAPGTGLVVQAGSAAHVINANINLGSSQTWEIDNSSTNGLTVAGVIGDGSTQDALTKTGSGTLILTNSNTYDGGTTVATGTMRLGVGGALAYAGVLTVEQNGAFDLFGNAQTVSGLSDGGAAGGIVTTSTGSGGAQLTVDSVGSTSYSGAITDTYAADGINILTLAIGGSGNLTLSGSNSFNGGTIMEGGNLTVASNYALGNPSSVSANAGLNFETQSGVTANVFFTSADPNIASLSTTVLGAGGVNNIILGNITGSGSSTTLFIGGGGAAQSGTPDFSGIISDRSATKSNAVGNIVIYGGGDLSLDGVNTFTGTVTVTGTGPTGLESELQIAGPSALQDATLVFSSSNMGIVQVATTITSFTVGGLIGTGTFELDNTGNPFTVNVGNNNVSSNFPGTLTGAGTLGKVGQNSIFTLSGIQNPVGGLTVTSGTLVLSGSYGIAGSPAGGITVGNAVAGGGVATLDIDGGTVYTTSFADESGPNSGNGIVSAVVIGPNGTGGYLNVSGNLGVDASDGDEDAPFTIVSGTVTAASGSIGRGNLVFGSTPGLMGVTSDGLYVNGGTLNLIGNLSVGSGQSSSANMREDAGVVTVGGVTTVANAAGGRFTVLDINGGSFTDSDTSGVGIIVGGNADTAGAEDAELLIEGGSLVAPEITLGGTSQTSGIDEFLAVGGTTTLGAGGIINGNPTGTTVSVTLGIVSVPQAPTIAASASWSTAVPMTLANSGSNIAPIFLTGSGANITLNGALSGAGGLTSSGSGVLTLNGGNSYNGATVLNGGVLYGNSPTALGNTTSVSFDGGMLRFGANFTQDVSSLITNSTGPISIDTNGQPIIFGSAFAVSNAGGLSVIDSNGGGSLTLASLNTYTAATSIGAGAKLILASTSGLGNTAISIVSGGIFAPQPISGGNIQIGTTGATLNIAAGGTLNLSGTSTGTVTLNSTGAGTGAVFTLGGTAATPDSLDFSLGNLGADEFIVNNGKISFAASAKENVYITALPGGAPGSLLQIPLLDVPNGALVLGDFSLQTSSISIGGGVYGATLSLGSGNTELLLSLTEVGSASYYFTGVTNSSWNHIVNFATDHTGSAAQSGVLGSLSNVFLVADNASNFQTETLDGNYTINSLNFTGTNSTFGNTPAATTSITLNKGTATQPLTIAAGNAYADANSNGYGAGIGVVVQPGSASQTIAANVNLGSNQSWQINNSPSAPLIVTGTIGGSAFALTKTGTGTLEIAAPETYGGGTIVNQGTLALGTSNALLTSGSLTVTNTGVLDLAGNNQTISLLADGGTSTGVITTSVGTPTLTLANTGPLSFKGALNDTNASNGALLTLALTGTSTVTLSGSSNYAGQTIVDAGTLTAANNHALGSGTSASGGLVLNPAISATVNFTSANPVITELVTTNTGTAMVVLGNGVGNGAPTTLTINDDDSTLGGVYNGTISDFTAIAPLAVGNLVVGSGTLTLNGVDTFTGSTVIGSGATLVLGNVNALEDSTVNLINPNGIISFGALTSATFGALTGSQSLALPAGFTLTIGANNSSPAAYTGALSGSGALIKAGNGVETLAGVNGYTGNTTINAGILTVTNTFGTISLPAGNTTVNTGTLAWTSANVNGANVYQNGIGYVTMSGSSTINLTGTLAVNSNNSSSDGAVTLTSGTVNAFAVTVGRDGDNLGTSVITSAPGTTDGLYVNGATVNVSGFLALEGGNSTAILREDSGTINVSGPTYITDLQNNRVSVLYMSGGTLNETDTTGVGIEIGGFPTVSGSVGVAAELEIGGTAVVNTPEISMGGAIESTNTVGFNALVALGGTIYIGSGGIANDNPSTIISNIIDLGASTVTTVPTIAASASWSSSLNMTLANSGSGASVIFQAANAAGTPFNITLSGALSGSGGLNKTGGGSLTLSGSDGYSGVTTVTSGALIVSGSVTASGSANVLAAARIEVDGQFNTAAPINVNGGALSGTGVFGSASIITSGTLRPGRNIVANTTSPLTATGAVTFDSSSFMSIRLGVATALDSDELTMSGSTVSLNDATLQLALGSAFNASTEPSNYVYVLINGGALGTGSSTNVFQNAPSSGSFITANGVEFQVYYGVNSTNTGSGSDVDLEFAAIPEPSTWGEILAGIGVLCVAGRWRRSMRRD